MKNSRKIVALMLAMVVLIGITGCLQSSSSVKGNVTGKVYDSNGKVLYQARVEIYGANHSVLTDELGRYSITGIDPGEKKLVATYNNKSVVKIIEIVRGETLENADLTFSVIDGLPPVITEVSITNITENTVDITWKTNESSDSTIDYATGPVGLTPYTMLASDSSMLTEHKIVLSGLLPGRTYHFRVRSLDFEKNEAISSDYQFSTPSGAAPATPLSFAIAAPTEMERVVLSWVSNEESDLAGYNLYRSEAAAGAFSKVNANPIVSTVGSTTYQDEGLKIACK
ncbi:MAG: carboxypeptidase regulatory-like domain-containing protein [Candidatus Riflebacteria bacterium]|nr:carboxypeptidase regulatory-like domain-containing protein [Candidatus Riflebacteria bacterium]